jgi:hypothetical protein
VTRLSEARLTARAAALAARRRAAATVQAETSEVSDGKRELGAAAGDLYGADGK